VVGALANGLELSCPEAQATVAPFSSILAGKTRSNFPHASRVSCSELWSRSCSRTTAVIPIVSFLEPVTTLIQEHLAINPHCWLADNSIYVGWSNVLPAQEVIAP